MGGGGVYWEDDDGDRVSEAPVAYDGRCAMWAMATAVRLGRQGYRRSGVGGRDKEAREERRLAHAERCAPRGDGAYWAESQNSAGIIRRACAGSREDTGSH